MKIIKILYILFFILIVAGCSNTKHLPKGDLLYTGGKVTINDSLMPKKETKALTKEVEARLRPQPPRRRQRAAERPGRDPRARDRRCGPA